MYFRIYLITRKGEKARYFLNVFHLKEKHLFLISFFLSRVTRIILHFLKRGHKHNLKLNLCCDVRTSHTILYLIPSYFTSSNKHIHHKSKVTSPSQQIWAYQQIWAWAYWQIWAWTYWQTRVYPFLLNKALNELSTYPSLAVMNIVSAPSLSSVRALDCALRRGQVQSSAAPSAT
jgi:hypothetical protein